MKQSVAEVQKKILQIMKSVDFLCRENGIEYMIMGGTALGAVRHGGFIPWDDDLDIFMAPREYKKFKKLFEESGPEDLYLQEWKIVDDFVEYAKVRMDGTTFIEEAFADRRDMHHGIYIDIMILHKCPKNLLIQRLIYVASKFVVLAALSRRNWKPKNKSGRIALAILPFLPVELLSKLAYRLIYAYDDMERDYDYCYYITKAGFEEGRFDASIFDGMVDIPFEDTMLEAPVGLKEYLRLRYGDYMKLPSREEQEESVHAMIYDTRKDYKEYIDG